MDTLSAGQAAEIYQLATECQALGTELAKQFQNLSGLEAMHCAAAQATAHETAQPALLCPVLQCAHHPTPAPGLLQRERVGDLSPAPCPASFPGEPNKNALPPPCLMRAAMAALCLKMTVSSMVRVRQVPMTEILTVAAAQMMKAPAAVSQTVEKHQMTRAPSKVVLTMKVRGPTVRQRGQMLEVAAAPLNLITQRVQLKHLHQQRRPQKSTSMPPRCSHYLTWTARILRRSEGPSGTGTPTSWTQTSASGRTKRLVMATCNGMSMTKRFMITQTPARRQNVLTH